MATTKVNTNSKTKHAGQSFTVVNAPGGVYHVYANGDKVFVKHPSTVTGKAAGSVAPTVKPLTKLAAATAKPATPAAAPKPATAAPDSTYYADQAKAIADAQQKITGIQQGITDRHTDLNETMRRLAVQQGQAQQNTRETDNNSGLLYSGHLGKALGDLNTQYSQQTSDAQTNVDRADAADQSAINATQAAAVVNEGADNEGSVGRTITSDTSAADAGSLAANAPVKAAAAPVKAAAKPTVAKLASSINNVKGSAHQGQSFKTVTSGGIVYHVYANGDRVAVRKAK